MRSQPSEHFISHIQAHHTAALYINPSHLHNLIKQLTKCVFFCQQIRQEKPYYIADPEVDSLVST